MYQNAHEQMRGCSKELLTIYKEKARGWAPDAVADITEKAGLDWLDSLTDTLEIWKERANGNMSDGELILAYVNLGILVEGWMILLLTVYREDYQKDAKRNCLPDKLRFVELEDFCGEQVWNDDSDKQKWTTWVKKIRERRNAVHAFKRRDIGTVKELKADLEKYDSFIVDEMSARLYKDYDGENLNC